MAKYGWMIGKHKVIIEFDFELSEKEKCLVNTAMMDSLMKVLVKHDIDELAKGGPKC